MKILLHVWSLPKIDFKDGFFLSPSSYPFEQGRLSYLMRTRTTSFHSFLVLLPPKYLHYVEEVVNYDIKIPTHFQDASYSLFSNSLLEYNLYIYIYYLVLEEILNFGCMHVTCAAFKISGWYILKGGNNLFSPSN